MKRKIVKIRRIGINILLVLFIYLMALVFYAALGYKLNPGVSSILIVAGIIALTFKTFLFFVEEARLWTRKKINKLIKRIDKFLKKENQGNGLAFS